MAQRHSTGGAAAYAKGKNPMVNQDRNDDLRVDGGKQKKGSRANMQAPREKSENKPTTRSASREHMQQLAVGAKAFYDTDASVISKDSTVGTIAQAESVPGMQSRSHTQRPVNGQAEENADEEFDYVETEAEVTDNDEDEDGVPQDPLQLPRMAQAEQHRPFEPDGHNLKHIAGDSYPDTTSGRLSHVEMNANQDHLRSAVHSKGGGAPLPTRGSGTRLPFSAQAPTAVTQQQRPNMNHHGHAQHSPAAFPGPDHDGEFRFSAAPPMQSLKMLRQTATQQAQLHQQAPAHRTAQAEQPKPAVQPQPQSSLQAHHSERRPRSRDREHLPLPQSSNVQTHRRSKSRPPSRGQTHHDAPQVNVHPQTQQHEGPSEEDLLSDPANAQESIQSNQVPYDYPPHAQPHYVQPPRQQQFYAQSQNEIESRHEHPPTGAVVQLDFMPAQLHQKQFKDLKEAAFDADPNMRTFDLPNEHNSATQEQKLDFIKGLTPDAQFQFFFSLSIEQWEDAGDWFVGRFGEALQKFKAARREKRRVSREFEAEVEKRHVAVSKKRKLTQDALGEMRESGGKILPVTPTKVKKTKQ